VDLFLNEKKVMKLLNGEVIYIPNFYSYEQGKQIFNTLRNTIDWQEDFITIFGKTYKQPRLTALYANNQKPYKYSNITMVPKDFTSELLNIKQEVEQTVQHEFTTVLLNLYRNGNDSNGWHADNEKELGKNPIIASVSFGASRMFQFKHRKIQEEKYKIKLEHGSLLIMKGEMQHFWLHQIPKTKKEVGERINLTFRTIETI
jgi:alkylated DNA repair dioxygenase AlkB